MRWTSWPKIEAHSSQLHGDVSAHMQIVKNTFWHETSFFWFFRLSSHGEGAKTFGSRHLRGYFLAVGESNFPCQKSCFFSASFAGSTEMARKVMFPCLRKRRRSSVVWGCQPKYLPPPCCDPCTGRPGSPFPDATFCQQQVLSDRVWLGIELTTARRRGAMRAPLGHNNAPRREEERTAPKDPRIGPRTGCDACQAGWRVVACLGPSGACWSLGRAAPRALARNHYLGQTQPAQRE